MAIVNVDPNAKRFGWQKLENGDVIPEGSYRRCAKMRPSGVLVAKEDRLACGECEIWRGCGTSGCRFVDKPDHPECQAEDRERLNRSLLDASGRVVGYETRSKYQVSIADPKVNEEDIDRIAAAMMSLPSPTALRIPFGAKGRAYKMFETRITLSGRRHFRSDGERCICGTEQGAMAEEKDPRKVDDRCCVVCNHTNVDLRVVRGFDPRVACFACVPPTGIERLEKRRGAPYASGESPDGDLAKALDDLELFEKMCKGAIPETGTREYWEHIINATKPAYLTFESAVSAIAATFDVGGRFVDEQSLAYAIFVAANHEEIKKRAEVPLVGHRAWSSTVRKTLEAMWVDPTYAKAVASAKESAARIWKAREVWR